MYALQRKVRILRDQLTKKDLQLECCKRKLALLEDGARGKCIAQVSFSRFEYFNLDFSWPIYPAERTR